MSTLRLYSVQRRLRALLRPLFILSLAIPLSACQAMMVEKGNILDPRMVNKLEKGSSSKEDVRALLGSPTHTNTFRDERWIYVQDRRYKGERVVNRLEVTFDKYGYIADVRRNFKDDLLDPEEIALAKAGKTKKKPEAEKKKSEADTLAALLSSEEEEEKAEKKEKADHDLAWLDEAKDDIKSSASAKSKEPEWLKEETDDRKGRTQAPAWLLAEEQKMERRAADTRESAGSGKVPSWLADEAAEEEEQAPNKQWNRSPLWGKAEQGRRHIDLGQKPNSSDRTEVAQRGRGQRQNAPDDVWQEVPLRDSREAARTANDTQRTTASRRTSKPRRSLLPEPQVLEESGRPRASRDYAMVDEPISSQAETVRKRRADDAKAPMWMRAFSGDQNPRRPTLDEAEDFEDRPRGDALDFVNDRQRDTQDFVDTRRGEVRDFDDDRREAMAMANAARRAYGRQGDYTEERPERIEEQTESESRFQPGIKDNLSTHPAQAFLAKYQTHDDDDVAPRAEEPEPQSVFPTRPRSQREGRYAYRPVEERLEDTGRNRADKDEAPWWDQ